MASNAGNPLLQGPRLDRSQRNAVLSGAIAEIKTAPEPEKVVSKLFNIMNKEVSKCEAEITVLNTQNSTLQAQIMATHAAALQV